MIYRLLYDAIDVGQVTHTDGDFPSCFGTWIPKPLDEEDPVQKHVCRYIEYSIESMRLLDAEDPTWEEFAQREEEAFLDLISSECWWLVEPTGTQIPILVPLFRSSGELTWRYAPRRETSTA